MRIENKGHARADDNHQGPLVVSAHNDSYHERKRNIDVLQIVSSSIGIDMSDHGPYAIYLQFREKWSRWRYWAREDLSIVERISLARRQWSPYVCWNHRAGSIKTKKTQKSIRKYANILWRSWPFITFTQFIQKNVRFLTMGSLQLQAITLVFGWENEKHVIWKDAHQRQSASWPFRWVAPSSLDHVHLAIGMQPTLHYRCLMLCPPGVLFDLVLKRASGQ